VITLLFFFIFILFFPIISPIKIYAYNIYLSILIICFVLAKKSVISNTENLQESKKIVFSVFDIFYILIFCGLPILSNFYSISKYDTVLGIYEHFVFLQLLILFKLILNENDRLLKFSKYLSLIIFFLGITAVIYDLKYFKEINRLTYNYRNPNILADIFFCGIIISYFSFEKKIKILFIVFLGIFYFLTKSVGAFLAFSSAVFIVFFVFNIKYLKIKRLIYAFVILLFFLAIGYYLYQKRIERLSGDPFAHKRLKIMANAVISLRDNYLFGSGHNTFEYKTKKYYFPVDGNDLKYLKTSNNPHNFILHLANELGVIGLILLFLFILELLIYSIKNIENISIFAGLTGVIFLFIHHQADVGYDVLLIHIFILYFIFLISNNSKKIIILRLSEKNKKIIFLFFVFCILLIIPLLNLTAELFYNNAIKYSEKNKIEKSIKLFDTAITLLPEHSEAYQRLGGEYLKLFERTNNLNDMFKSLDYLYRGYLYNKYNSNFQLNISKALQNIYRYTHINPEFPKNSEIRNYIKYYIFKSIETEPYNNYQYIDGAEILYKIGFDNDAIILAKLGLTNEPYFTRLHKLLGLIHFDNNERKFHNYMYENCIKYSEIRKKNIFTNGRLSTEKQREEQYYHTILYNTKLTLKQQ